MPGEDVQIKRIPAVRVAETSGVARRFRTDLDLAGDRPAV